MATWKKVITTADIAANNSSGVDNGETGLVTGNAVYDYIQAQGFGTGGGDITSVVAGNGLGGGATTGDATLSVNVDNTTIQITSDNVAAKTAAIADGGTGLATADQIHTFVTGFGYTTNTGTVTSVATGDGLSGGTITGSGTITVDSSVVRTTGNQSIGGTKTFSDDVVITGDLTVNGDTTTLNVTNLNVEDKIIKLADVTTPSINTGHLSGIQVEVSETEAEFPELIWDKDGDLTGWTLSNYNVTSSTDFPVSVMQFGTAAPSSPAIQTEAGVGAFFVDSTNGNFYIYI